MNKDKLKRKLDEQTARDHTNMRHWMDRRHTRFEKLMDDPVLPSFCNISFYGMLIATAAAALTDIVNHLTYLSHLGFMHMVTNAVSSAFLAWTTFSLIVLPCTLIQLKRGFDHPYFDRFVLNKRGQRRMPIKKRFTLYLLIDLLGLVILGAAYALVKLFT